MVSFSLYFRLVEIHPGRIAGATITPVREAGKRRAGRKTKRILR
jgi:hypothetical protein